MTLKLLLTCFVGVNLRSLVSANAPLLPELQGPAGLSLTEVGLIASMPTLVFAVGAIPGAMFVHRIGFRLLIGFGVAGAGLLALSRLLPPTHGWLVVGTIGFAICIAVVQPALSPMVTAWFPQRKGQVMSGYSAGMVLGGLLGAGFTPYILAIGGWPSAIAVWSLVCLITGIVWLVVAPGGPAEASIPHNLPRLLRHGALWRAAGLWGAQNLAFYSVLTWIPFLISRHDAQHLGLVMFFLNGIVIVPALALSTIRWQYATSSAFYLTGGVVSIVGALLLVLGATSWDLVSAALVGTGTGLASIGAWALPSVDQGGFSTAAFSALMMTIGYAFAFAGPLLGGILYTTSGLASSAVIPAVVASLVIAILGMTFRNQLDRPSAEEVTKP